MAARPEDVLADLAGRAEAVLAVARDNGWTVATAESLTGGLLTAALVAVPGASDVVRGGITAYQDEVKAQILGVDAALLERTGPVTAEVAGLMAQGACRVLGADIGISTTGVAGPASVGDVEPGTAYVAVQVLGSEPAVRAVRVKGDRTTVRVRTVVRALELCEAAIRQSDRP
ncbi:MAG: nicotinamide-nucleotide amidohydrolase family protein [Micrococcales bacterium]|nr:nicotinamide-nucleotide amidohydrolase family protein [Micrococcales bacterium]